MGKLTVAKLRQAQAMLLDILEDSSVIERADLTPEEAAALQERLDAMNREDNG
jgi:hypothetical protein